MPNRRFIKAVHILIATPLVALLGACGGTTTVGGAESTAAAQSVAPFPTAGSGELHIYNWTDYVDTNELKRFEQETGIKVILDVYDSNETMLAKLQSGATGYDIIFPSDYMVAQLKELNMLQQIDVASFPNGKNIKPEMLNNYWDAGRKFTAPYMYGTSGIACLLSDPECSKINSWHDYFTSTSTKISELKDQQEVVSVALRASGTPSSEICTTDKARYQAAADLLKNFHPSVIESDGALERIVSGTSTVSHMWNGEAHRLWMENKDMRYIYPSEGLNLWADNIAVPIGAPNVDNAKLFINWMLDPKNIAAESNYTGYDNSIVGSSDYMDESMKNDPAVVVPEDKKALLTSTPACLNEARDLYTQVFTTWLSQQ